MAREKTGGRSRGTKNRITNCVKDSILDVFEEIGGIDGFAQWALENRSEFYRHYAKLLPVTMSGKIEHDHTHTHESVSDSSAWITELLGDGQTQQAKKPLPN